MLHLFDYQLPFIVNLLLLLLSAKILGELFERAKQPSMIGEVLAGVILGPSVFNIIPETGDLKVIADLGVFFLIILAGLEIEAGEIRNTIKGRQMWIALTGFIIPFLSGFFLGLAFGFSYSFTIFLALSLAITALPVTVRILMDIGQLHSDTGRRIIFAAIFNDILALLILGILLDFHETDLSARNLSISILLTLLKIILFIIILTFTYRLFRHIKERVGFFDPEKSQFLQFLRGKESQFALVVLFLLFFSSVSELLGLYFVVGAFFGAILIPRSLFDRQDMNYVKSSIQSFTTGFLSPIFFATIGISLTVHQIDNVLFFTILLVVAFSSKLLGGFIGGKLAGLPNLPSYTIGIGLNAHGIMELVIANIAFSLGFINASVFAILVMMALITTMITPLLLGNAFRLMNRQAINTTL